MWAVGNELWGHKACIFLFSHGNLSFQLGLGVMFLLYGMIIHCDSS